MQLSRTKIDRFLSTAQRKTLCDWLLERSANPTGALVETGLRELVLWEDAGEPSANSINEWLHKSLAFEIAKRDLRRANEAAGVLAEAGKGNMDEANQTLIQSMIFKRLTEARKVTEEGSNDLTEQTDISDLIDAVINLGHLRIKERQLGLGERRIALLEAKAAKADEAESTAMDATLTPAQKEAKMKAIFGIQS